MNQSMTTLYSINSQQYHYTFLPVTFFSGIMNWCFNDFLQDIYTFRENIKYSVWFTL